MDAGFSEDQEMIREAAASFLTDWQAAGGFRAIVDAGKSHDDVAWQTLAAELGFAGLTISETNGGAGLSDIERALVMQEMGRTLFMSPFFATCVLATDVLQAVGGDAANGFLKQIAAGNLTATFKACSEGTALNDIRNVIDGAEAELVLIAKGDSLFAVHGADTGLVRTKTATMDLTRGTATLNIENAAILPVYSGADLSEKIRGAQARSAIALSAEQVGGAEEMLNATVEYVKERKQFGRVVGGFQAVKHRCADMMIAVEASKSGVYLAAAMAEQGGDTLLEHAAIAKSEASDAYSKVTGDAIQMHGGVGVTWEYDMHFHFKRARAGKTLLGSPAQWRDKLAALIGVEGVSS